MTDFTVIPNAVKSTLESGGHPLTEEQYLLMCGSLAAAQTMIEQFGLAGAIEVLEPMKRKTEKPAQKES